jgi:hypothetical protein
MSLESHPPHETGQEVGSFGPSINQGGHEFGAGGGDDKSGVSTARAEVDDGSDGVGESGHKGQRMVDDRMKRSAPQHADALGITQRIQQLLSMIWAQRGNH